ncbi:helix-turn-helix transcriptional regulator [Brevundimonas diminuta]|uniref:helix-turn-helix domain-containing protein n=1 Tax=Brevundimonas diminuta TaxID=293 RepID=UPI0030F4B645
MAQRPRKARHDLYEAYRDASGWWLAAWRDFRGLTLEDLADELGRTKGYVSDIETGAARGGRPATRFNRDTVDQMARALGTTGGRLIDVNPYEMDERANQIETIFRDLDPASRDAVIQMAQTLSKRSA